MKKKTGHGLMLSGHLLPTGRVERPLQMIGR
jgi:hypothetical protein